MANQARKLRTSAGVSKRPARDNLKRSARASISYKEDSSDEAGDEYKSSPLSEDDSPPPKRQKWAAESRSSGARRATSTSNRRLNRRNQTRRKGPASATATARKPVQSSRIESDGHVPPWCTLPYEILRETFTFAFEALQSEDRSSKKAISWILDTACLCKTFTEPALSALYRYPPLLDRTRPHKLLELLARNDEASSTRALNLGAKVKRLELEAESILAKKTHTYGMFDMGKLVMYIPQLSEIDIYLDEDLPPYSMSEHGTRWHYPDRLFSALDDTQARLRSFKWNFKLFGDRDALLWMKEIHQKRPFQSLRHITIANFLLSSKKNGSDEAVKALAANCTVLPELESICFQSSPGSTGLLLRDLPPTLRKLRLESCILITSDDLHDFLESHGLQLKELVLLHNRALDLAFLPHLGKTAPGLQLLKMDLNYFHDTHRTSRNSQPLYETLLASDEIPTWPRTLQTLEMSHLRKWENLEAAKTFFQSLVDSAKDLPDLRTLVLKVILNSSWRERADFREKWIPRLQKIFLRKSDPPNPNLASLRAFRRYKILESGGGSLATPEPNVQMPSKAERSIHRLLLDHVSISPRKKTPESDGPSRRTRLSRRTAQAESASEVEHSDREEEIHEDVIQGMCETVDIIIDNQRPADKLFNEGDFMDDEVSGDEDWTGDNDESLDDGYAW
ncbi:MAG: hypothetical protein M1822_005920 [Bathelium mastoideum]|nr:MAG: hypothetical protein M1822_005920 [Bathelium mastoideum]